MGDTACKVPDAHDYIEKAREKGAIGKKRKTVKCYEALLAADERNGVVQPMAQDHTLDSAPRTAATIAAAESLPNCF